MLYFLYQNYYSSKQTLFDQLRATFSSYVPMFPSEPIQQKRIPIRIFYTNKTVHPFSYMYKNSGKFMSLLNLYIPYYRSNDIVSTKIYDKRDDFDFEIVNFQFLDGVVPRSSSCGVYISQLIRFARASSHAADFNTRNKLLTQKLLKQGYGYHKLRKTFSKFYRRYYDLISKFQVGLKSLLRQGLSKPE